MEMSQYKSRGEDDNPNGCTNRVYDDSKAEAMTVNPIQTTVTVIMVMVLASSSGSRNEGLMESAVMKDF